MIGYFLFIALLLLGIALIIVGAKKKSGVSVSVGVSLTVMFGVLIFISTVLMCSKQNDVDILKKDRDYYQDVLYSVNDKMSPATIGRVFREVEYINKRIEKNKNKCDDKVWGFFYNKEIAVIEPIDMPKITYEINLEN